jgi:serine/threonine protein kinase/signal transduction histidine kinase
MATLQNNYDLLNPISKSRESDVFLVRQKETSLLFLLKSIKQREDSVNQIDLKKRFYHEMDVVSSLDHPHIAKPYDTIIEDDTFSILYPYERGDTLAQLFEIKDVFAEPDAMRIAKQLLNALEYIHGRGIIHSDINPHNIFITEEKGVQLLDFGFSMSEDEARKIPEGRIIGTFPFLSPEQMGFTRFKIDTRTDLFCTAIILYRMLAGKLPFPMQENSLKGLLDATIKREVAAVRHVPKFVNMILLKGLKPTPFERYQTAEGFYYDVSYALDQLKTLKDEQFIAGQKDAVAAINRKRLFVVRQNEIELLCFGLGQLIGGKGKYLLLYGRSGIGKTEIVREFKSHVDDNKCDFISAKSNRFTPNQPYSILRQLIIDLLLKIATLDSSIKSEFKSSIDAGLAGFSGIICRVIPEMRDWFEKIEEIDVIEKEKEADRVIHVLSVLFTTLCKIRKLIVFIDDFQWVDRITFDVVKNAIEQKTPCLLICNYRTGANEDNLYSFGQDLKTLGFNRTVHVKPFSKDETRELVTLRFGSVKNTDALVDALFSKTDGVPFVLTEAIRYLVNNSLLNVDLHGWSFKTECVPELPSKFDSVSLILNKLNDLSSEEKSFLQLASLIEGKFECATIEKLGNLPPQSSQALSGRLETLGFISAQLKGGYVFIHDRIQETIVGGIEKFPKFALYERLGGIYLEMASADKHRILDAAECYLKSNNLSKAMEICFQAAMYAFETIAFDVAIRYFKSTLFMAGNCEKVGIKQTVDLATVNMALGDVLMLTGANEQAMKIFEKLNENKYLSDFQRLEVKYKIGTVYHNMGEFEKATPCFISAVREMGIIIPEKRLLIIVAIFNELFIQCMFSLGIKKVFNKKNDKITLLKSRILNKLSYSLYFSDMILAFYVHFRSLNLADRLIEGFEKAEAYSSHQVPIYQMLFKKRAFKYLNRGIVISNRIHRFDSLAFAQCFGGNIYYYNAKWNKSEEILLYSNKNYTKIGDIAGQLMNLKHLWKIGMMRGHFNDTTKKYISEIVDISKRTNERFYNVVAFSALNYFKLLTTNIHDMDEYNEIENKLQNVNSFLYEIEVDYYLLNIEILLGKFEKAYLEAKKILPNTFKKSINSEYQVGSYALFCYLIINEQLNRLKNNPQINAAEGKLKKDFNFYSFILWFSCLSYPAYWGSFYRNIAWFFALQKRKNLAKYFFKKAIKNHHKLDMRYEEACSIRDYGTFLDDFCNLPGEARDRYNEAYKIFEWCGSKFDTDKLEAKILPSHQKSAPIKKETTIEKEYHDDSSSSTSGSTQLRIDMLLQISSSMTEIRDMDALLKQILSAMITATGAQYGRLVMNRNSDAGTNTLAMNFEGKEVGSNDVPVFQDLIDKVNHTWKVQFADDAVLDELENDDGGYIRSDLCVPLNWRDKYLGYIYLVNDKVKGLFGEGAQKTAQILAAQAGILLENANLMNQYKELNAHLQQQVQDQTKDIHEKNRQLEDFNLKLVDSERMKNLLSGTLVHDIKNYVAGIEGNVKLLEMKFPDHPKIQRTSAIVSNCCTDIISLTSNLLDIAKMEEGKLRIKKGLLRMNDLAEMLDSYKTNAIFMERKLTITIKIPAAPFEIEADSYLLGRILQNLFSNALKYAPGGGAIVLEFIPGSQENIISFFSSGTPIPDENKESVFEKYGRLEDEHSVYSKGLGLFFCRMVMNAHGGRIWLDTDDNGNYFKLSFKTPDDIPFDNDEPERENDKKEIAKNYAEAG